MQRRSLLALALCLALLFALLAGCSPAPQYQAAKPGSSQGAGTQTGGTGTQSGTAPEGTALSEPTPEPTPTPSLIKLNGADYSTDQEQLTAVITAEDVPLLEQFYRLKSADFSGSDCQDALLDWAYRHPEITVRCEARLPDGTVLPAASRNLDLSGRDLSELRCLRLLPELESVDLGSCEDAAESDLNWQELAELERLLPQVQFRYAFTLYGKSFDLQSEVMDLNHITMDDEGALVKKIALCMPRLSFLDMDFCEVSDEAMADIRDALPGTEVVWRIFFGEGRHGYSVRTNVTTILASNPDKAGTLEPEQSKSLMYCTKVRFLDLGHNKMLSDISFVSYMPDLEVAILGIGGVQDISPLANCTKLEYLELQTTRVTDLRPLSGLKNLRHLNLCWNFCLTDITPLYELTELERLWLGKFDPVPPEQIEEMQRRAPNCEINTKTEDPSGGGWRFTGNDNGGHGILHPRYALLYEQFNYGAQQAAYSYWNNDPLYAPHD